MKAIIYFEIVTTIALVLGIVLAYVFQPGVGMNIDPKSLDASSLKTYVDTASQVKGSGTVEFLMKLIPTTFVGAFSSGDVLQVLLLAVAFGCALSLIGDAGKPVSDFIEHVSHVLFKMMYFIVRARAAWRARRDRLHRRQVRRRVAEAARLSSCVVFYGAVILFVARGPRRRYCASPGSRSSSSSAI